MSELGGLPSNRRRDRFVFSFSKSSLLLPVFSLIWQRRFRRSGPHGAAKRGVPSECPCSMGWQAIRFLDLSFEELNPLDKSALPASRAIVGHAAKPYRIISYPQLI